LYALGARGASTALFLIVRAASAVIGIGSTAWRACIPPAGLASVCGSFRGAAAVHLGLRALEAVPQPGFPELAWDPHGAADANCRDLARRHELVYAVRGNPKLMSHRGGRE
jgi:hypothetical protein